MSLATFVRQHDSDRYFCTLFAPASAREALFTLYAFNHELARAQEVASAPALALIRLQWWREVVEGEAKRHEVATALHRMIGSGALRQDVARALIDARDDAVSDKPMTQAGFLAAMAAGPGALAQAAGAMLGADAEEQAALRAIGAAYGVAGTLRNLAVSARRGQGAPANSLLHGAIMMKAGLMRDQAMPVSSRMLPPDGVMLREAGLALAGKRVRWRRPVLAAALPGVLARRDLRRAVPVATRGIGDRVAILRAAALGVV